MHLFLLLKHLYLGQSEKKHAVTTEHRTSWVVEEPIHQKEHRLGSTPQRRGLHARLGEEGTRLLLIRSCHRSAVRNAHPCGLQRVRQPRGHGRACHHGHGRRGHPRDRAHPSFRGRRWGS